MQHKPGPEPLPKEHQVCFTGVRPRPQPSRYFPCTPDLEGLCLKPTLHFCLVLGGDRGPQRLSRTRHLLDSALAGTAQLAFSFLLL